MKTIHYNQDIHLIQVEFTHRVIFSSAIEKENYRKHHIDGTYELFQNHAEEYRYIVVDTSGSGWIICAKAISYNECINVIKHYL